jgi:hypothetical protein
MILAGDSDGKLLPELNPCIEFLLIALASAIKPYLMVTKPDCGNLP